MIKKGLEVILFSGTIPLGALLLYSVPLIFAANNKTDFFRSISIAMLSLLLLGVLVVLLFFSNAFSNSAKPGRISGIVGKKVYSNGGNYIGEVKEVSVKDSAIYGLAVNVSGKKKITVLNKDVIKYGEVIMAVDDILEKIK